MIQINKDDVTMNVGNVSKEELLNSSINHINEVELLMRMFGSFIIIRGIHHDFDKIEDIDSFYEDHKNGWKTTEWYNEHVKINRHHLNNYCPEDVNLIDVIEMLADCVAAGLARDGKVKEIKIDEQILNKSIKNTIEVFKKLCKVIE